MMSTFVSIVKLMCMDRIARQNYKSQVWKAVAVTSLIVMSSCIKVSKQHNFHWVG